MRWFRVDIASEDRQNIEITIKINGVVYGEKMRHGDIFYGPERLLKFNDPVIRLVVVGKIRNIYDAWEPTCG